MFSDDFPLGAIVSQSIAEGTEVPRGTEVSVVVSRGPDLVVFPDISAAPTFEQAAAILGPAGFQPVLTFGDAQGAIQSVAIDGQPPQVGSTYRRGTVVEFTALVGVRSTGAARARWNWEGRVAVVTGAGRGLGREHALLLGECGAAVVVNDRGVASDGTGGDTTPAEEVAAEIRAHGGSAVASDHDVASWDGASAGVELASRGSATSTSLVNNAGILRDSTLVRMTEDDFDEVRPGAPQGPFRADSVGGRALARQHKAGVRRRRNLVHTSSTSGIYANPGQINYGTAKSGIVTFSQIAAKELAALRRSVSNCVVPGARTRLTMSSPGLPEIMEAPAEGFDVWSPGNVSPVVAYLCGAGCPFTGETFYVHGGTVRRLEPGSLAGESIENPTRWPLDELDAGDDGVQAAARVSR